MELKQISNKVIKLIKHSLNEDIGSGDITSEACIPENATLSGRIILKQWGCLAGLQFIETTFHMIDPRIIVKLFFEDGDIANAGAIIGTVSGPARGIITAERVVLNLIQHASGVATMVTLYREKLIAAGRGECDILDTRKTLPGLRALEKFAVRVAGGKNHRSALDDRFVIKSNHLAFVEEKDKESKIVTAVKLARKKNPNVKIEVEVDNLTMLNEALKVKVDIIMLKYMPMPYIKKAVSIIRKANPNIYIEAHGGDLIETIAYYAEAGVDGISVTEITHSVPNLDISLRF